MSERKPYRLMQHVRREVGFREVLIHYELLTESYTTDSKGQIKIRCPLHGGTKKTLSVNLERNLWYCFSSRCQRGGNLLDFVAALRETTPLEAAQFLYETFLETNTR